LLRSPAFGRVEGIETQFIYRDAIARGERVMGEMFNAALLCVVLIPLGLSLGFLLLKLQGGEE
jgi:cytochrome b6-f complex subunit 7